MPRTTQRTFGAARKPNRLRGIGAVALAALLVLTACASSEGDQVATAGGDGNAAGPAGSEETAPLDEDAQALVFAQCMRDNGVDMPDPGPGQQGLVDAFEAMTADQATLNRAFAACQDLIPQYSQQPMHEEVDMLALAECLREQGLDVSDNPFQDAHSGAIDQTAFAEAMEVCRDVLTGAGQ